MFRLKESIHVNAPLDRCFLLSTSVALVEQSLRMRPVAGKTTGLVVNGDRVLWRGWKFGLPAWHESVITRYERPNFFQDTMRRGMFRHFQHDHRFQDIDGHTLMADIVRFSMPLGLIGREFGKGVVVPHILDTLLKRFELLKRIAEGPDWERYIVSAEKPPAASPLAQEVTGTQRV
jgi:ligand-binding SRPBCC domain-containing protein